MQQIFLNAYTHIHTCVKTQLYTRRCEYAREAVDLWSSELISATERFQEIAQQPHIHTHSQRQTNTCKACDNRASGKDVHLRNCKCQPSQRACTFALNRQTDNNIYLCQLNLTFAKSYQLQFKRNKNHNNNNHNNNTRPQQIERMKNVYCKR